MILFGNTEKTIIFSGQKWANAKCGEKIRVLRFFAKEIAKDFGMKSTPHLVFIKNTPVLGAYRPNDNTLMLNETIALEGRQQIIWGLSKPYPNNHVDTLFAICHELEHAAQYQRVRGKLEWKPEDDKDGISINLQQNTIDKMMPYIKGMADVPDSYEFYFLQPSEYDANQVALMEINALTTKYKDCCSEIDLKEFTESLEEITEENDVKVKMEKKYQSVNIVRDISYCLQNLFLGKQYPVPPDLMRNIEDACRKSYEFVHSPRYQQLEMRLKKEINRQLAAQEYER